MELGKARAFERRLQMLADSLAREPARKFTRCPIKMIGPNNGQVRSNFCGP